MESKQYNLLVENLPDGFALHQVVLNENNEPVDYEFLEVNRAFEELTGLTREEILGKRVTEVLPGIELSGFDWIAVYGEVALTGKITKFEAYSDPLRRWYEVTAFSPEPGRFAVIFKDITDRKEKEIKEETALKSQQLAQSVLDSMNANVCVLDGQGYIIATNQSWFDFAVSNGGKIEEVRPGINYLEVCDQVEGEEREMAERFAAGIRELIRGERDYFYLEYPCHAPEKARWFICEATSFFDMTLGSHIVVVTHIDITERKHKEESLQRTTTNIKALLANSPALISVINKDGMYVEVSDATAKAIGLPPEEIKGKTFAELLPPALASEFMQTINALREKKHRITKTDVIQLDGEERIFETLLFPIEQNGNDLELIGAIATDVTERRQMEEDLLQQKNLLKASIEALPYPFYIINAVDYTILMANSASGLNPGEHPTCYQFTHQRETPCDGSEHPCPLEIIKETGQPAEVEHLHYDYQGNARTVSVNAYPVYHESGELEQVIESCVDITEKREWEKQLTRFRQALDSSADGVYLIDGATYRFVDANEPGCEALGYTRQELMELTPFDIQAYLSREELEGKFASAINRSASKNHSSGKFNSVETFETYHQRKDGSCFPVEVSLRMVEVAQEQLLVATVRDITERKQTERLIEARLNLLTFASDHTLDAVLQKTLDEVGDILNSPIGFFHFVSDDETMLTLKAWSTDTLQYFCDMGDKSGMQYRVEEAGVWADCVRERRPVIHNDYASLSHRKGIPEDHAMVVRELVVPVIRDDRIVAILGIGNKYQDYTDEDVQVATFFADVAWEIVEDKLAEQKILDYAMEVEMKSLQLESVYSQLNEELDKARIIHERNLPEEMPEVEGLSMHAYYQPAWRMGGDFYHAVQAGNKLVFYLSDVSGHGMEGALLSAFVKGAIDSYITLKPEEIEPGKMLHYLNRQYYRENYPDDYFICIFLMVLDLETMELIYTGAGFHELPLVQLGTGEKLSLRIEGPPISSVIPEEIMDYPEGKIKLTSGSTVLVSTDGLTEQLAGEELYGQRLSQVFYEHSHLPPEIIISAILEDFYSFNGGSMQAEDDITLGVIQIEPEGN